ncbi:MAG: hypothetical protein ACI9G1_004195 [Pirellulaceae bacterium]|jgi:hypothetical protein
MIHIRRFPRLGIELTEAHHITFAGAARQPTVLIRVEIRRQMEGISRSCRIYVVVEGDNTSRMGKGYTEAKAEKTRVVRPEADTD